MNFCSKYIGISILLVALFLMPGIGNSQAIVTIEQEPVCWTTSGGADSSLTRYVLFSSRTPTAPQVLCYVNASGTIVVPSGGTFAPGWCGCCGDGPATADNDWYFVTGSAISDPIWRSGRVLIGTPDNLPTDTSHQLQLEGDWQFLPDGVGSRFDWQNTTDTTGTAWYGILLSAPAGLGGSSNLSGSRNTFALGTSNTVIDRTRLGVLAFAGNNPNDTDHALGAFMEAVANGAWTSSSTATDLNVWVTASGEIFPRNTVTFQGDGRVELDRYFTFSDGIPQSLLGFDTGPDDITRHPIAGTAAPGNTIVVNGAGNGLEWGMPGDTTINIGNSDLTVTDRPRTLYSGLDSNYVQFFALNTEFGGLANIQIGKGTGDLSGYQTLISQTNYGYNFQNVYNAGDGVRNWFGSARGTIQNPSPSQQGDAIFYNYFRAYSTTGWQRPAIMGIQVDTFSGSNPGAKWFIGIGAGQNPVSSNYWRLMVDKNGVNSYVSHRTHGISYVSNQLRLYENNSFSNNYTAIRANPSQSVNWTLTLPNTAGQNGQLFTTNGSGTVEWGPRIFTGTGSPETVLTAPVGSLYTRTDGGANTTLYVKESGTGNTGWVAK